MIEVKREHLAGLLLFYELDGTVAISELIAQASAAPFDTRRMGFEKFAMHNFPNLNLARHRQGAREGDYCNPIISACWKSWNGALPRTASFAAAQLERDKKGLLDNIYAERDAATQRADAAERKRDEAFEHLVKICNEFKRGTASERIFAIQSAMNFLYASAEPAKGGDGEAS